MINNKKMLSDVFELIWKLVQSDGGDGCGVIFCTYDNYKEISNQFKFYIDTWLNKSSEMKLLEEDGYDLITDGCNENFIITSDKDLLKREIDIDLGVFVIKI